MSRLDAIDWKDDDLPRERMSGSFPLTGVEAHGISVRRKLDRISGKLAAILAALTVIAASSGVSLVVWLS